MMMSALPADALARLTHEIGLRTFADRFLDLAEEREVLAIAGRVGIPDAGTEIARICREQGTVREVDLRVTIREALRRESNGGKLDEPGYHRVVAALSDVMTDRDRQRQVIAVMEEVNQPIKRGWFSNWYLRLKQTLGIP